MINSGVYIIVNTVNTKIYVGSTVDIITRWTKHCAPSSSCTKLANAMRKHGVDKFKWYWLETVSTDGYTKAEIKKMLLDREQHYLHLYTPFGERGYNICQIAGSTLGITFDRSKPKPYKHTPEYLAKVSGENSKSNKAVSQHNMDGTFVRTFYNITYASEVAGATIQAIARCCNGKDKTAAGFRWCYADAILSPLTPHKSKQVIQTSLDGSIIATHTNARSAAASISKGANPIYKCCRGEQSQAYGFIWKWI